MKPFRFSLADRLKQVIAYFWLPSSILLLLFWMKY